MRLDLGWHGPVGTATFGRFHAPDMPVGYAEKPGKLFLSHAEPVAGGAEFSGGHLDAHFP